MRAAGLEPLEPYPAAIVASRRRSSSARSACRPEATPPPRADPDSRYAGRYFLPRQRQLEVWTQIGFGIVNEFIGLLGGEPISAPDGVGALQRQGR